MYVGFRAVLFDFLKFRKSLSFAQHYIFILSTMILYSFLPVC